MPRDLVSALFWLAVAIFAAVQGVALKLGSLSRPGPGFFPFWGGVVLALLSLVLLVNSLKKHAFWSLSGLRSSKLLVVVGALLGYLVRFHVAAGPFNFRFSVQHVVSWRDRRIHWRLDQSQSNDLFRDTWGYWQLEPASGGRVMVTYAMGSQTVLPAFLTRGSEQDSVVKT